MDVLTVLRSADVLVDFDPQALARLAAAARFRDLSAGEVILHQGRKVEVLGIVVHGSAEIRFQGERPPVKLLPGQVFGEISLLNGEPALADVVAPAAARVLEVPQSVLALEMARTPAAAARLASLIVKRLVQREEDPEEQQAAAGARSLARKGRRDLVPLDGRPILVLNSGPSSLKIVLFREGERVAEGRTERLGLAGASLHYRGPRGERVISLSSSGHEAAIRALLDLLVDPEQGVLSRLTEIAAVGHRVVHGGTRFTEAVLIDDTVLEELRTCAPLAPRHNPANLFCLELCQRLLVGTPQVAVLDTAFHQSQPEHAWRYAIPRDLADRLRIRRYGFHGTSHKYIARVVGTELGISASKLRIISCHLGRGSSMAAIDHGRSVDTSMGFGPLDGLVMATRAGDIDASAVLQLQRQGMSLDQVEQLLSQESGLQGLSGLSSDMRELEAAADQGHPGAILAIQAFCYRVRKTIGAYAAVMGGFDVLAFTGGIGENAPGVRARVCQGLGFLGVRLDPVKNSNAVGMPLTGESLHLISEMGAEPRVLVIPTDEERMISLEIDHALERAGTTRILRTRRDQPIPIGVSAHHVHLTQEHVELLFGPGHQLQPRSPLSQPGQFASEEVVDLVGPKGRVDRVRVLGPVRKATQVEISRTEEFKLGIDAPVRLSGDLAGSPGLVIEGSAGSLKLEQGVICARRHIHMSPAEALTFGLRDLDEVRVRVEGNGRSLIFGDTTVRLHPDFRVEMHLDTDEANAAEIGAGAVGFIDSIQHRRG